jgi:hypothetical protein
MNETWGISFGYSEYTATDFKRIASAATAILVVLTQRQLWLT